MQRIGSSIRHTIYIEANVFTADGVPAYDRLPPGTYVLMDEANTSDDTDPIMAGALAANSNAFLVYTSSEKKKSRWLAQDESGTVAVILMNPWSWLELKHTCCQMHILLGLDHGEPPLDGAAEQLEKMKTKYVKFGPVAGDCLPGAQDRPTRSEPRPRKRKLRREDVDDSMFINFRTYLDDLASREIHDAPLSRDCYVSIREMVDDMSVFECTAILQQHLQSTQRTRFF